MDYEILDINLLSLTFSVVIYLKTKKNWNREKSCIAVQPSILNPPNNLKRIYPVIKANLPIW